MTTEKAVLREEEEPMLDALRYRQKMCRPVVRIYFTGTLISPDDSGTNVYGEPVEDGYGQSMESGWVDPNWDLMAIFPNKEDVRPTVIDLRDQYDREELDERFDGNLDKMILAKIGDTLGAIDFWDGETAYAADPITDHHTGESMMLAAHVEISYEEAGQ